MDKYSKQIVKVLTPFVLGSALFLTGAVMTGVGTAQGVKSLHQIDSYYNKAVYQTIKEDLNNLQTQFENNEISKAVYENAVTKLKREATKEFYKNDDDFLAIIKNQNSSDVTVYTGLGFMAGSFLTLVISGFAAGEIMRNEREAEESLSIDERGTQAEEDVANNEEK